MCKTGGRQSKTIQILGRYVLVELNRPLRGHEIHEIKKKNAINIPTSTEIWDNICNSSRFWVCFQLVTYVN